MRKSDRSKAKYRPGYPRYSPSVQSVVPHDADNGSSEALRTQSGAVPQAHEHQSEVADLNVLINAAREFAGRHGRERLIVQLRRFVLMLENTEESKDETNP